MTVKDLLSRIDSDELTEWAAFDRLEPFGDAREDLRTGIVAAAVVNHSMSPPRTPMRPIDFMLFAEKAKDEPVLLDDPVAHSKLIAKQVFNYQGN